MANIRPFKGVVYNKEKTGDLSKVIAPPYDIIPAKQQKELYRASPYNIVRLELGKIRNSDNAAENRYTRARKTFNLWLKSGHMIRDEKDTIYIYSQKYREGAKVMERIGFIALMAVDGGKKKVLPHENTLLAPKMDRLNLIREVKANLSPIFVLYEDTPHAILKILKSTCSKKKPFIDAIFEDIRNRAWKLDDKMDIKRIQSIMRNARTFIADGHHRFEVSRMYSRELGLSGAPKALKESAGYVMVYFVESKEDMLTVLPAHRLSRDTGGLTREDIISRLQKFFVVEKASSLSAVMTKLGDLRNTHVFGIYLGRGEFYTLKLKSMNAVERAIRNKPKDWKKLDVVILHLFIFRHVLGIHDDDDSIEFVKSPRETAEYVDKGKFKMAFFLNPTKVAEIKRIASLGEKMPRKATYFFPKQVSGIVVNKL